MEPLHAHIVKWQENFLKKRKLNFKILMYLKTKKNQKKCKKTSGQSAVPVIDINGKIIIGFDREKIEDALK